MKRWLAVCAAFFSLTVGACVARGDAPLADSLTVRDAWARAADSGAVTALYFTLANEGPELDTLLSISTDVAESADLHVSMQQGRMMHMSPVRSLPVPGEDSVSFRPLGAHVMLTALRRPLIEGDSVSATLAFASGRTVRVIAGVRRP